MQRERERERETEREEEEEEEEEFIWHLKRARRFLTRWTNTLSRYASFETVSGRESERERQTYRHKEP